MSEREKTGTQHRTHPKAEKAERTKRVVELMASGAWEPGVTAPALAVEWGVELWYVEQIAVTAKRAVGVAGDVLEGVAADNASVANELGELRGIVFEIGDVMEKLGKRIEALEAQRRGGPGSLELALRRQAEERRQANAEPAAQPPEQLPDAS